MGTSTRVLIVICMVLIAWFAHATSETILELGVKQNDGNQKTFTRLDVQDSYVNDDYDTIYFTTCLCDSDETSCKATAYRSDGSNQNYTIVTNVAQSSNNRRVPYFVCFVTIYGTYIMTCTRQTNNAIPCSMNPCSVNINFTCPEDNKIVTLVWSSSQNARVYDYYDFVLHDCCQVAQATTEMESTIISSATTITTTQTTTNRTLTTLTTTLSDIPSKKTTKHSSPQEDTPTLNSTLTSPSPQSNITTIRTTEPPLPSPSDTPTGSNNSAQSVPEKQTGDSSSQFTGLHIGVIVGTAVAAVILTLIIVCVIWKIKTRSKNNQKYNSKPDTPKLGSTNQTESSNNVTRTDTNDSNTRQLETATISSPVVSHGSEEEYSRISQAYNYIDIGPTTNLTANMPGHEVPAERPRNSNSGTDVETDASEIPNVYSHLGESAKPENPYNYWPDEKDSDSYSLANLTGSSPETNHSVDNKSAVQLVYNTTQQHMLDPESGIKKPKQKSNIFKPAVNYTEIDLTTKVNKTVNNDHSGSGQQTDNGHPGKGFPTSKPNNTYYDIDLPEPNPQATDGQLNSSPLFPNPVYTSQADLDTNPTTPSEEQVYFNDV